MNYGKKQVNKKIHSLKSLRKRVGTKLSINAMRIFLLVILGFIITCGFAGFGVLNGIISSAPSLDNVNVVPEGYVTRFFYTDGTVSQTLIGAGGNREYIAIEDVPPHVYNAFVAIEDERFWKHDGIDVRSIIRSMKEAISNMSLGSGGSTITQQLLKNQVFAGGNESNKFQKLVRKIQEQYLAVQLESITSKEKILEYYLNTINMGQGSWGIEMAATTYYGKSAPLLTVSEAAVLACIAQSPVRMNPYTEPANNRDRREEVLDEMLENNFITQEEYDEAIADTDAVYQRIHDYVEENSGRSYYTYFTDEVISQLMTDLMAEGYTSTQASNLIYTGGLQVYTTQDREAQEIVDSVVNNLDMWPEIGSRGSYYDISYALSIQKEDGTVIHYQLADLIKHFDSFKYTYRVDVRIYGGVYDLISYDKEYMELKVEEFKEDMVEEGDIILGEKFNAVLEPQISFVLMDHSTGAVTALCGGRGDKFGNRVLDRATNSLRSVGSTYKVLAAYLPAFDTGTLTLASTLNDAPYFYPNSTRAVSNWYSSGYKGLQSTRYAISYSLNILACRAIETVTPKVAFSYLQKLGFTSLVEYEIGKDGLGYTDIGVPLALGGLTYGVTNLELTAAYAAIANGGVYNKPFYYSKVVDHAGNIILEHQAQPVQVMKTSTAYLLTSAMEDTLDSSLGTASVCKFKNYEMNLAGKSGTTSENYDLWFEGFSPYYTAGVWEGFDIPYYIYSTKTHEVIWREIMEQIHTLKQLPNIDFNRPDTIITKSVCSKCGKLAIDGLCDKYIRGNCIRTEYFAKGTEPVDYCDCHQRILICKKSGLIAQAGCSDTFERVVLVKDEPEVWTPVDTDYTTLSPTPTPPGYVLPTATPALGVSFLPTATPTPTNTPVPSENDSFDPDALEDLPYNEQPTLMAWFDSLYRQLMNTLLENKPEAEEFYTENYEMLNELVAQLTPTPVAKPTYIATKKKVAYTTADTNYRLPAGYCYDCSVKAGIIKGTPTPIPTYTPTPTNTPTPTFTPEEFKGFLTDFDLLLNPPTPTPSPTPTPIPWEGEDDEPFDEGGGLFEDWEKMQENNTGEASSEASSDDADTSGSPTESESESENIGENESPGEDPPDEPLEVIIPENENPEEEPPNGELTDEGLPDETLPSEEPPDEGLPDESSE